MAHRIRVEASPPRFPALALPVALACLAVFAATSALQQSMELRLTPWQLVAISAAASLAAAAIGARGGAAWAAILAGACAAAWMGRAAFFAGSADPGLAWLLRWWKAIGPSFRGQVTPGVPINIGPISLAICLHACGAALLSYRAARREPVAALLVGGGVLLGFEVAYLTHGISRQVLLFFATGLALQALGAWSARRRRWRQRGFLVPSGALRWWAARAGLLGLLGMALAWWLPANGPAIFVQDDRLRFLDGYIADLLIGPDPRDRTPVAGPLGFNLPQAAPVAGYGWSDGQLGGPFRKIGGVVMSMRSPRSVYLRGESKETYTGRGWLSSEPAPAAPLLAANLAELGPPPAEPNANEPLRFDFAGRMNLPERDDKHDVTVEVEYATSFRPWPPVVFAPWPTRALELADAAQLRLGLRVDPQSGNIYAPLRRNQPLPLEYKLTASLPPLDIEALKAARVPEGGFSRYLQLPQALPERVRDLARDIARGAASPYEQAAALESWLKQMPYVEDVPAPPADTDFVDDFLFNQKRGYCVYFSSAMVVMARSLGLPARWVKGFTSGEFDEEGLRFTITDGNAHAWVEVFLEGHGWVAFDPTPGFSYPRDVVGQELTPVDSPQATSAPESPGQPDSARDRAHAAVGVLLLGLLAAAAWWSGRSPRTGGAHAGGGPRSVRATTVAARIRAWFRRLEEKLARVGLGRKHHETPSEFQARVARALPGVGPAVASLVGLYHRARYGRAALTDAEAAACELAWREIELRLRDGR